jgi:hypothetical protein
MDTQLNEHISVNLRALQQRFLVTNEQLATYLQVDLAKAEAYLAGTQRPSLSELTMLSDLFWVSLHDLLQLDGHQHSLFPGHTGEGLARAEVHTLHHLASFYRIVTNYCRMTRLLQAEATQPAPALATVVSK